MRPNPVPPLALTATLLLLAGPGPRDARAQATASEPVRPIGAVQGAVGPGDEGNRHRSPLVQQRVAVQGVVHQVLAWKSMGGRPQFGILLQNTRKTADGNPDTSDGLLVFLGGAPVVEAGREDWKVAAGDELVLAGTVGEYHGFTQLKDAALVRSVRRGVDLDAELPAPEVSPPAGRAEAQVYWERLEGMRVRLPAVLACVSGRHHNGRNDDAEIWVVRTDSAVGARAEASARRVFRNYHPLDDEPGAGDNGNGFRFALSSQGLKGAGSPDAHLPPARSLDQLAAGMAGGVLYTFGAYQVAPVTAPAVKPGPGPDSVGRPAAPARPDLVVAAYNVENLYDFRNDPFDTCDFASDPGNADISPPFDYVPPSEAAYAARLGRLARQVIADLHAPDLLLIQEVEDQDICAVRDGKLVNLKANDADGRPDALQELCLAIRAAGGPEYDAAADRSGSDARGITCGFLYRTDRVALAPAREDAPVFGRTPGVAFRTPLLAMSADVQNPKCLNAGFTPVDKGDDDPPRVFTRAVQAAHFHVWKERAGQGAPRDVFALSNHFTSRPEMSVVRRRHQAALTAAVVRAIEAAHPGAAVIVGGDLNTFPRPDDANDPPSDQLEELYRAGLANLHDRVLAETPASAYSYVYTGESGTLDHLFVNAPLAGRVKAAAYLHINSDWPSPHEGDLPRGASDHDPAWAVIRLFD